jgi:hypothetical protein
MNPQASAQQLSNFKQEYLELSYCGHILGRSAKCFRSGGIEHRQVEMDA